MRCCRWITTLKKLDVRDGYLDVRWHDNMSISRIHQTHGDILLVESCYRLLNEHVSQANKKCMHTMLSCLHGVQIWHELG